MDGCTLGVVFSKKKGYILFKNRDLTKFKVLPEPQIVNGDICDYIKFGRSEGQPGIWMGVNGKGIGILGADAYTRAGFKIEGTSSGDKTFEAYEKIISSTNTLMDAYHVLIDSYVDEKIGDPDIILIAQPGKAMIIEYVPWEISPLGALYPKFQPTFATRLIENKSFVVKTNFFEILTEFRQLREEDVSSYKRYERAVEILSAKTWKNGVDDIKMLCKDHINGPSANSICRHGGDGEFSTVASVIAQVSKKGVSAKYVINKAPCKIREYNSIHLE